MLLALIKNTQIMFVKSWNIYNLHKALLSIKDIPNLYS